MSNKRVVDRVLTPAVIYGRRSRTTAGCPYAPPEQRGGVHGTQTSLTGGSMASALRKTGCIDESRSVALRSGSSSPGCVPQRGECLCLPQHAPPCQGAFTNNPRQNHPGGLQQRGRDVVPWNATQRGRRKLVPCAGTWVRFIGNGERNQTQYVLQNDISINLEQVNPVCGCEVEVVLIFRG